jgi:putative DNA primase/helicase
MENRTHVSPKSLIPPSLFKPPSAPTDPEIQNQPLAIQHSPPDPVDVVNHADCVITVVRDPHHNLGKAFTLNPDGTISKQSAVNLSFGVAVMHRVNTHEELAALLHTVSNDPQAAIINASFPGIAIGEEFLILSEREIESRLGIPRSDRERQKGIHEIENNGKIYKAVGRFKENVRPSRWQYFDRDIDQHTPEQFRNLTFEEWISALVVIVPGLTDISYCHVGSTSARVFCNGKPVGDGNGHLWVKVDNPEDIERFRTAIIIAAAKSELTWTKPRYSCNEPDTIVGHSLTTIFDPSVLTPGRLTFYGKPIVSEGLTVEPMSVTVFTGTQERIDTALVTLPDKETIRDITRKAGVPMDVSDCSNGLHITAQDLTLDTEIETEDHNILTVREIIQSGSTEKKRCQTPFRDSSSYAAFLSFNADGKPFVYDVGTSITHWLNDADTAKLHVVQALGVVDRVITRVPEDCGAPFEPEALQALKVIQQNESATYQRLRAQLKKLNSDVSVVQLDIQLKDQAVHLEDDALVPETHHGYARDVLARLTVDGWKPVGYEGSLYVVDSKEAIWVRFQQEKVVRIVAETHDGNSHCARSSDYFGIANHALMLATDDTYFADAPIGLATPDGFYRIEDNQILVAPLTPAHRQRVKINVTPENVATPLFDAFLNETFKSNLPEEEAQQVALVQEIAGAIMTGCMHKFHKAGLFYDPFGRAGKGTLERILRELVPPSFVTAVSPFNWDKEYYLASLVSTRLNVVGELPEGKSIPAAAYKTVIGGDLLTGRHPNNRPISFKNEAGHLFMSNHFITTNDHSEAFFARWLLIRFPNSRLRLGLPLDPGLSDRIIQQELPGIAYWALTGAKRLLSQDRFSSSIMHNRLMEQWRRTTNSLEEYIHECCIRKGYYHVRRAELYQAYKQWCGENGRRPFSKGKVKELLEHNIALNISLTVLDGYEIFRGVMFAPQTSNDQRF